MPVPDPVPGLVIRYAYLWRSEADAGREEGRKDRPCAIVLATRRDGGKITVVVAPITHTPPRDRRLAIEIPAATKARLRLDDEPSWVVVDDLNYFVWPGPDIRPIDPTRPSAGFAYGLLPASMTSAIQEKVRTLMREGRARAVGRGL